MKKRLSLKFLLFLDIALILIFIFYKSYLFFFEADFEGNNIRNIKKVEQIKKDDGISFAVFGNINNSIDIFDKKIIKKLNNDSNLDFAISTGDSVLDGTEDKYRVLNRDLKKVNVPTILGVGTTEISKKGAFKFYEHYGPFYFSYNVGDAYFVFLDTTGETDESYQKEWLVSELKSADSYKYKFVFMNKPPYKIENLSNDHNNNIKDEDYATFLTNTFSKYNVTSVFCSSTLVMDSRKINNVQYFVSSGAGGSLLVKNKNSYYNYIKVTIKDNKVDYTVVKQPMPFNMPLFRILENCWFFMHSFFYLNFFTFILILSILVFFAIVIKYKAAKVDEYYTDFDELPEEVLKKESLNIAMFTNNYVPFIGGVPISIVRLTKGLRQRGHNVIIFAPDYPEKVPNEASYIIRLKLLIFLKTKPFDFPIVNIFSPKIEEEFLSYNFDIVHSHHPFWMGKKGLALGRKHGIPVILTYHTRLEKYAHNLPAFHKLFEGIVSHNMTEKYSQKCNAVFAPTSSAKEYLANIGVSRHKVVLPTGVDFDFYNKVQQSDVENFNKENRTNNEIILCTVSRLTEEKNIYFLLKGIKYVKEHCKLPFKCIIIGDGPEKENIINTIKRYKISDCIQLVGSINPEKVCFYYKASDIFVFSSQSETQGMVILEAMAGSCPVVAVRSSGIDDVIKNNYNGFKTKAEVALWGEKVIYLMENPDKLQEMSQNAFDFSNKFSLDSMAEITEGVYYESIRLMKSRLKKPTFSETFKINLPKKGL